MSMNLKMDPKQIMSVLYLAPVGFMLVDLKTHKIVDVNRAYSDIVGIHKDRIIGQLCNHLNICSREKEFCTRIELRKNLQELGTSLIDAKGKEIPVLRKITICNFNGDSYYLEVWLT